MIALCSRWALPEFAPVFRPDVVLTFMDPGARAPSLGGHRPSHREVIEVHDLIGRDFDNDRRWIVPSAETVWKVMEASQRWGGRGRILVSCDAGVSRSSAGFLIVLATLWPRQVEKWCWSLRAAAPWVEPNSLMIEIADELLSLNKALVRGREAMGDAKETRPKPITLDLTS